MKQKNSVKLDVIDGIKVENTIETTIGPVIKSKTTVSEIKVLQ